MKSYEDYGSPFCVMDWERYIRAKNIFDAIEIDTLEDN